MLVVITIIGVLAGIGIPSYNKYKTASYHSAAKQRLTSMASLVILHQNLGKETVRKDLKGQLSTYNEDCIGLAGYIHPTTYNTIKKDASSWHVRYGKDTLDCGIGNKKVACIDSTGTIYYGKQVALAISDSGLECKGVSGAVKLSES